MDDLKQILRYTLLVTVSIVFAGSVAYGQYAKEPVLSGKEISQEIRKITKKYNGLDQNHINERELDAFVKKHCFKGEPVRDSLIKIRIKESYFYNSGDGVSSIKNWLKLISKYSNYSTKEELEAAHRKVAESYFGTKNYLISQHFFEKSLSLDNEKVRSYVNARIGSLHIIQGDLDAALEYYHRAVNTAQNAQDRQGHLNSLGYVYYLRKEYKLSGEYYDKALKHFSGNLEKLDSIQYYIVQSNMASLSFALDDFEKGISHLQRIEQGDYLKGGSEWFELEVYFKFIEAYVDKGNCTQARKYWDKHQMVLPDDKYDRNHLKSLEALMRIQQQCGGGDRTQTLNTYVKRFQEIEKYERQRMNVVENIQRTIYEEQLMLAANNLKLKEDSKDLLEVSNSRLKRLVWISVIGFILIIAILVMAIVQRRGRQKRKESFLRLREDLLTEKENSAHLKIKMAQQEVENQKLELSQMLNAIDKNSSLFDGVLERLGNIRNKEGNVSEDISQLMQFIRSMSRSDEMNDLIEKNAELVGAGFKDKIETRYPNLTSSELQLVVLIKLGLSTKEMAQLKNVEPSSIRIFKHRLKTKLNLNKNDDLTTFIQQF